MDDLTYLNATVDAELETIRRFAPNVVFTENQFTAAISTKLAGLPLVSTAASVNHPEFSSPLYPNHIASEEPLRRFNRVLTERGLDEITSVFDLANGWSTLNVAPTSVRLEPLLLKFPNIHYVGPLLYRPLEIGTPVPCELPEDQEVIYVYMSNGTLKPEAFVPVLVEAFGGRKVRVLVALRTAYYSGTKLPIWSENIGLYEYLPGSTLTHKSAMVITRGGQNTMMTCFLGGTPVFGFPGANAEADFNVRTAVSMGAALGGRPSEFTPANLRAAFEEFQADTRYRKAAAQIGAELRSHGGSHEVVELMQKLV